MSTLDITNFSCLSTGKITTSKLTAVIGPQASGKSILSKLIYFFNRSLIRPFTIAPDLPSFDDYQSEVDAEFRKWFPLEAWGERQFIITYSGQII